MHESIAQARNVEVTGFSASSETQGQLVSTYVGGKKTNLSSAFSAIKQADKTHKISR